MKFTKSIHWRLLFWIAFLLGLILLALDFTAYEIHFSNRVGQLDGELQRRVAALSAALYAPGPGQPMFGNGPPNQLDDDFGPPPPGENPPPDQAGNPIPPPERPGLDAPQISAAARRFAVDVASGFYFSLWARESAAPYRQSTNCPAEVSRPPVAEKDTGTYARTRGGFREMFHTTERGDCVLAGHTLAPEIAGMRRFAGWLTLGSLVVLAFGLGGAWFIIGRALQPVERISATAQRIAGGNLSERINAEETESELGQLAGVLNSTFARLETSFAQQKQFTSDASHELRTPIAVLISEAQTTLARERSPADYRDSIAACLDTAQEMRRLTDSLLELARLDAGQETLRREKTSLSAIVEDCVNLIRPLAATRRLQIRCDLASAEVFGDTSRLAQVVTNLLTNAIAYNRDGGEIRIATRTENSGAILRVADTGCGISAADLPRVFERFYRANKSRTGGHTGLGLAISKSIVEAHGGTIEVASEENVGTTFTVFLPGEAAKS
jgi:heavy metal sensor kinase